MLFLKEIKSGEEIHEKSDNEFDMSIFKRYENNDLIGVNYSECPLDATCKYDIYVGGEKGEKVKGGC